MPPLDNHFPSMVCFYHENLTSQFTFFLVAGQNKFLISSFIWRVFCCDGSKGPFLWCSEDIQKLPLATVICCNPPETHMIDRYEPIPIFLNVSAFLVKKVQAEMEMYNKISFFFCHTLKKKMTKKNICMRGFNTAFQGWVSCSSLAREKAVV